MKACAWAALVGLAAAAPAMAQVAGSPPYNPQPVFSPYLNMNRSNSPLVNYYGVVRPQLQTNRSIQQLGQEIQLGQNTPLPASIDPAAMPLVTGHAVSFMNTASYFPMYGARPGSAPGSGPIPQAPGSGPALGAPGGAGY